MTEQEKPTMADLLELLCACQARAVNATWSHDSERASAARAEVQSLKRQILRQIAIDRSETCAVWLPDQPCEGCRKPVRVSIGWPGGPVWCLSCYNDALGGEEAA